MLPPGPRPLQGPRAQHGPRVHDSLRSPVQADLGASCGSPARPLPPPSTRVSFGLHTPQPSHASHLRCSSEPSLHTSTPTAPGERPRLNSSNQTADSNSAITVVFSDELGIDLGYLLHNCLSQDVQNICMPGASFKDITDKLLQMSYKKTTTVVLLLSHSSGVDKVGLINFITSCANLDIQKCIIGTLPYFKAQHEYNNCIFNYNTMLYNLTCLHSDKLFIFDTNLISNFYLRRGTLYLSHFYKKHLANLLAKNIFDPVIQSVSGNSFVSRNSKSQNLN